MHKDDGPPAYLIHTPSTLYKGVYRNHVHCFEQKDWNYDGEQRWMCRACSHGMMGLVAPDKDGHVFAPMIRETAEGNFMVCKICRDLELM